MIEALCGRVLDWQPTVLRRAPRVAARPMPPQMFLFGAESHRYSKGRSAAQFVHDLRKQLQWKLNVTLQ
jgi:hypothetical protein